MNFIATYIDQRDGTDDEYFTEDGSSTCVRILFCCAAHKTDAVEDNKSSY